MTIKCELIPAQFQQYTKLCPPFMLLLSEITYLYILFPLTEMFSYKHVVLHIFISNHISQKKLQTINALMACICTMQPSLLLFFISLYDFQLLSIVLSFQPKDFLQSKSTSDEHRQLLFSWGCPNFPSFFKKILLRIAFLVDYFFRT